MKSTRQDWKCKYCQTTNTANTCKQCSSWKRDSKYTYKQLVELGEEIKRKSH